MLGMILALGSLYSSDLLPATITRSSYGVPRITAVSVEGAYEGAGYAVAQDRLWQMEMARRTARGRMSAVVGRSAVASDTRMIQNGYLESELQGMIDARPALKASLTAYAAGVNRAIAELDRSGKLPEGYARLKFSPEPWTVVDSAAIAVMMARLFGSGGSGEIRNWAALQYLQGQPNAKNRALDILGDLVWQNDAGSPTTVRKADQSQSQPLDFGATGSPAETVARLPKIGVFELFPAAGVANMEDTRTLALASNVVSKTGSYAMVVAPKRSATGRPLLLSAPQMGWSAPSPVYELTLDAAGLQVHGIVVPGIPFPLIGYTPHGAWGLTTGVADTDDIFFNPTGEADSYTVDGRSQTFWSAKVPLSIAGQAPQEVLVQRTRFGPVVLKSRAGQSVLSQRRSFWGRELESFDEVTKLYSARTPSDFFSVAERITVGFNLFFATKGGDIGWAFCGLMPLRSKDQDPRFPTPGDAAHSWRGIVPIAKSLRVLNPKDGLLTNWNNKPIEWWPNLDTPAWGRLSRVQLINDSLRAPKLSVSALETAAFTIARRDADTLEAFLPRLKRVVREGGLSEPYRKAGRWILGWEGEMTSGSHGARIYREYVRALRERLFLETTGNFVNPDLFSQGLQPSVMLQALERKTKVNYLGDRTSQAVILSAFRDAVDRLVKVSPDPLSWRFEAGSTRFFDQGPVPYLNRGTYIQIVELEDQIGGRTVNGPGIAESGTHATDQIPLLNAWTYKPGPIFR
jgi:penicillin amidase